MINPENKTSICIIGTTSLLTACIEKLLNKDYKLTIVSNDNNLRSLYSNSQLQLLQSINEVESQDLNFDYILSIVNPSILSESFLKRAKFFAINYHDSLLPQYSGTNATFWSLLHGEKSHGISWHIMSGVVDAGNIIKQISFKISTTETRLSLNLKCYSAAIESFDDVIRFLEKPDLEKTVQQDLANRSYFSKKMKPENFGSIDPNKQTIREIQNLIQACNSGDYDNEVCIATITTNKAIYIANKVIKATKTPTTSSQRKKISKSKKTIDLSAADGKITVAITETPFQHDISQKAEVLLPIKVIKNKNHVIEYGQHEKTWLNQLSIANQPLISLQDCSTNLPTTKKKIFSIKTLNTKDSKAAFTEVCICLFILNHTNSFRTLFSSSQTSSQKTNAFLSAVLVDLNLSQDLCYQDIDETISNKVGALTKLQPLAYEFLLRKNIALKTVLQTKLLINLGHEKPHHFIDSITHTIITISENENEIIIKCNSNLPENSFINKNFQATFLKVQQWATNKKNISLKHWIQNAELPDIFIKPITGKKAEPAGKSIIEQFKHATKLSPTSIAVSSPNYQLSYQQLDQITDYLADKIFTHKKNEKQVVGICCTDGVAYAAGIISAIKSGATFVPIDTSLPSERLRYLLDSTPVDIVLTDHNTHIYLIKIAKNTIMIDCKKSYSKYNKKTHVKSKTNNDDILYIMFTSGSTGTPKGVQVSHRNYGNLCKWYINTFFTNQQKVLVTTALCFDLSQKNIIAPLLCGSQVHFKDYTTSFDARAVLNIIKKQNISLINCTPSIFYSLKELDDNTHFDSLQHLILGAEPINPSEVLELYHCYPNTAIYNTYGPAEYSDITSCHKIIFDGLSSTSEIPIGAPIDNTSIAILNHEFCAIKTKGSGELLISGTGLSQGYINNDPETQKKFIKLITNLGAKDFYRTGDIVTISNNNEIAFLNRKDSQIKFRGYRIELGEITTCINRLPDIQQSYVLPMRDEGGNILKLIGAIVPKKHNHHANLIEKLNQHLAKNLPKYAIPSQFSIFSEFPRTRNGKVDTVKLLEHSKQDNPSTFTHKTEAEKLLAQIWQPILKLKSIHPNDNFFGLGGSSLLANKLRYKLEKSFNIEVSLHEIYKNSSFKMMAALIKNLSIGKKSSKKVFIEYNYPAPLSQEQQRIYFMHNLLPAESAMYNLPVVVTLTERIKTHELRMALDILAKKHSQLCISINDENGQPIQTHNDHKISLEEHKSFDIKKSIDDALCEKFDIQSSSLIKAHIFNSKNKCIILIILHHIISDIETAKILVNDLSHIYTSLCRAQVTDTSNVCKKYLNHIYQQAELLKNNILNDKIERYAKSLENGNIINWPKKPNYNSNSWESSILSFNLDHNELTTLEVLAKDNKCSLFTVLVHTLSIAIYKHTNQTSFTLGMPTNNRHQKFESVVGLFINTVAFNVEINSDITTTGSLSNFINLLLETTLFNEIPFDIITDKLNVIRDIKDNPIFNTFIEYIDQENNKPFYFNKTPARLEHFDSIKAKFDITFRFIKKSTSLECRLEYKKSLYDQCTMRSFLENTKYLLTTISQETNTTIKQLSFMKDGMIARLVNAHGINKTKTEDTQEIGEKLNQVTSATPNATALSYDNMLVTYSQLYLHMNSCWKTLADYDVESNCIVGIFGTNNILQVVATLTLLWKKITFVPIDQNYPEERIKHIIFDAKLTHIINCSNNNAIINNSGICNITLSIEESVTDDIPFHKLPQVHNSNEIAYIIYTSGSTGTPKGVIIKRSALFNIISDVCITLNLKDNQRFAFISSIGFDISFAEMLSPLFLGKECIILDNKILLDANELGSKINSKKIDCVQLTASAWQNLLNSGWQPKHQIKMLSTGEALYTSVCKKMQKISDKIYNLYGPTEGTIYASSFLATPDLTHQDSIVSIGKALPSQGIIILNSDSQPLPQGFPGNLHIYGDAVAKNYTRPQKNNPFIEENIAILGPIRLYQTGDIAYYGDCMDIIYCKRASQEYKFNGFRVDCNEIKRLIQYQLQSTDPLVLIQKNKPYAEDKLYVFILNNDIKNYANFDPHQSLHPYLAKHLPYYSLPTNYSFIDKIPKTTSGKVDINKLFSLPETHMTNKDIQATSTESNILSIWLRLLNRDNISISQSFFEAGGNSMLSLSLANQLSKYFSRNISVVDIFRFPTIKLQSQLINDKNPDNKKAKRKSLLHKRAKIKSEGSL